MAKVWIPAALFTGAVAVLAGPALLVYYQYLRPEPWNPRVRFESVRYEAAGLVFTYVVENSTRRTIRFLPGASQVRAVQEGDLPAVASVSLPLYLEGHSSQRVDVRLELSAETMHSAIPSGQTESVFGFKPTVTGDGQAPVSPLPRRAPPGPVPSALAPTFTDIAGDALRRIEGFELLNQRNGIRIFFPRAW